AADTISVTGSSALTSLTLLSGAGDDSIQVGDDLDSNFLGPVTIDGGGNGDGPSGQDLGSDTIVIDDSADAFGDTYTFGGSNGLGTLAKSSGGATLSYRNVEAMTLIAGVGGAPVPNNQQFLVHY